MLNPASPGRGTGLLEVVCCKDPGPTPPPCCGTPTCGHTVINHDGHVGYLSENGHLFCQLKDEGPLVAHSLQQETTCFLVELLDHLHGPGCGHELVPHEDHYDYLVGDELHHISSSEEPSCCSKACVGRVGGGKVINHGHIPVIRHRGRSSPAKDASQSPLLPRREALLTVIEPQSPDSEKQVLVRTQIFAAGICCPSEVPLIHNILSPLPGVSQVEVGVITKTVTVLHSAGATSPAALLAALNAAHLDASFTSRREQAKMGLGKRPPLSILGALLLLIISVFHYAADAADEPNLEHLKWLAVASVAVGIPPVLQKAIASLRNKVLDINLLVVIAAAGAIAIGDYTEAAAVVVLMGLAEYLQDRCTAQARDAIAAVVALKPDSAVLVHSGREVAAEEVPRGSLILVRPGAAVPIDGIVESGASQLDHSLLTGESLPVTKTAGDQVLGGTLNVGGGPLEVRTTALASESAVARMADLVEKAASQQTVLEGQVARFAKFYTPAVVVTCFCLALIPLAVGVNNPKHWVYLALEILVTACPCALVLSTPVTVVAALARAAREGVLIKGGPFLEALAAAKVVTFDKTGTLTVGRFQVIHSEVFNGESEDRMLTLVGSVERGSGHPLAAAVVGWAAARGQACNLQVEASEAIPGQGVVAEVEGQVVTVGNRTLLQEHDIAFEEGLVALMEAEWGSRGATLVWVALEGQLVGLLVLADSPRPEARDAIAAIKSLGLQCAMLTGDNAGAAAAVAGAVGIEAEHTHAALLPEDKLALVHEYSDRYGKVVHVGDGINDAPALVAADIGIAMGSAGAAVAIEAADVALFTEDLRCLAPVLQLGLRARRKIAENIAISVLTKVAVMVLAACGLFTLWGAVLVDVGTALVVILNGMTLLHRAVFARAAPEGAKCCVSEMHGKGAGEKCCSGHQHSHNHNSHVHNHGGSHSHGPAGDCCSHNNPLAAISDTAKPVASCCSHDHSHSHSHSLAAKTFCGCFGGHSHSLAPAAAPKPAGGHAHGHSHSHSGADIASNPAGSCCSSHSHAHAIAPAASLQPADKGCCSHVHSHAHSHTAESSRKSPGDCCGHSHSHRSDKGAAAAAPKSPSRSGGHGHAHPQPHGDAVPEPSSSDSCGHSHSHSHAHAAADVGPKLVAPCCSHDHSHCKSHSHATTAAGMQSGDACSHQHSHNHLHNHRAPSEPAHMDTPEDRCTLPALLVDHGPAAAANNTAAGREPGAAKCCGHSHGA